MPARFDYTCPDGHVTELLKDRSVRRVRCECGRIAVRTIASVPPVSFKGQGFTRYRA